MFFKIGFDHIICVLVLKTPDQLSFLLFLVAGSRAAGGERARGRRAGKKKELIPGLLRART